jgi:uncharacterized membrane protein required for colicin V production
MGMTFDIVAAILILFAAWRGWKKGASGILMGFVTLIAAILIATLFGNPFGKAIGVGPKYIQPIVGFFILFAIVSIIGSFIEKKIKPKQGMFAGANSALGAVFGFVRMTLILGLVFSFGRIFGFPPVDEVKSAVVYPFTIRTTSLIASQLRPILKQLDDSDVFEEMMPIDTTQSPPPIQ